MSVSAVILAGGKATRLGGVKKHELVVSGDGQSILARQRAVLEPRVAEVLLSGAEAPGLRTVRDAVAGQGPLGGVAAALAAAETEWLLVVAGDMPDVHGGLIDLLLAARAGGAGDGGAGDGSAGAVDAVTFRIGGRPEPLLSLLRVVPARAAAAAMLAAGRRRASQLFTDAGLRVAWIDEATARAVDPALRGLRNVNEPADL